MSDNHDRLEAPRTGGDFEPSWKSQSLPEHVIKRREAILSTIDDRIGSDDSPATSDHPQPRTESLKQLIREIDDRGALRAIARGCNYLVQHYLAMGCSMSRLSASTARNYARNINEYIERTTDYGLDSFLEAQEAEFYSYIRWLVRKDYRPATIECRVSSVKCFHEHIGREFDTAQPSIPMTVFERFDIQQYENDLPDTIERGALTESEIRKLLDATDSFRDYLLLRIVYEAALRNSEVRNLRIRHVDLDLDDPRIEIKDSKNEKNRTVPILGDLALEIEYWIQTYRPAYSKYAPESEFLFPSLKGVKLESNHAVWTIVHEAAEEAGLQDPEDPDAIRADGTAKHRVDVHVLRHTGNRHWQKSGIQISVRQELMGHENEETTVRYSDKNNVEESAIWQSFRNQFDPATLARD